LVKTLTQAFLSGYLIRYSYNKIKSIKISTKYIVVYFENKAFRLDRHVIFTPRGEGSSKSQKQSFAATAKAAFYASLKFRKKRRRHCQKNVYLVETIFLRA